MSRASASAIVDGAPIAIIDDVQQDAETTEMVLSDARLSPHSPRLLQDPRDMVGQLVGRFAGVVCDHRLQKKVPYLGAELVALCMNSGLPAVLITSFAVATDNMDIQRHRRYIPDLLLRGKDSDADHMRQALSDAANETAGHYRETRRPYRTPVRIVDIDEGGVGIAYLKVPAWSDSETVGIPVDMIPNATREIANLIGERYVADVNIYCEDPLDIYAADLAPLSPATFGQLTDAK